MRKTYLATPLLCTFVIHNTRMELPAAYRLIKDKSSWAQQHKGRMSKRDRRK